MIWPYTLVFRSRWSRSIWPTGQDHGPGYTNRVPVEAVGVAVAGPVDDIDSAGQIAARLPES